MCDHVPGASAVVYLLLHDTAYGAGHVVERQGREVNPLKKKMRLLFMPPLDPNSNDYSDLKHVELDEYGTFEYTVDVGSAAKRRGYTVSLRDPNDQHLTSVEFIVGEPRIPSALLKLITPEWVSINFFLVAAVALFVSKSIHYSKI